MKKPIFLLVAIFISISVLTTFTISGCASAEEPVAEEPVAEEPVAEEPVTEEPVTEEPVTEEPGEVITVGWLSFSISDDWFAAVQEFAEYEARNIEEEFGVQIEFRIMDAGGDVEEQLKQVDDMMLLEPDMIYFEPIDETAMARAVERINEEMDIPVSAGGIWATGGKYIYVGLDNIDATVKCGEKLVNLLNEKYGEGNWPEDGVIIETWGPPGLQITVDRHTGFRNALDPALEQNPGVEVAEFVTNWDPDTALGGFIDLVESYGDRIIGIYTDDDTAATEGAWRSLEMADMAYPVGHEDRIPIVTYDGTLSGNQAIRDGWIDMLVEQPAFAYGYLAMRYMYIWHVEGFEALPQPGTVLTEDDLGTVFPEEAGYKHWTPVEVREGLEWDGIWLAPNSPVIPDEVDPYDHALWGNYLYQKEHGYWPGENQ